MTEANIAREDRSFRIAQLSVRLTECEARANAIEQLQATADAKIVDMLLEVDKRIHNAQLQLMRDDAAKAAVRAAKLERQSKWYPWIALVLGVIFSAPYVATMLTLFGVIKLPLR
jgi:hypothetical protein